MSTDTRKAAAGTDAGSDGARCSPLDSSVGSRTAYGATTCSPTTCSPTSPCRSGGSRGRAPTTRTGSGKPVIPSPGRCASTRLEPTGAGFLLEFEERWHAEGQDWYCREMMHAVVSSGRIAELSVYCTGDWDEAVQRRHAAEVTLARP